MTIRLAVELEGKTSSVEIVLAGENLRDLPAIEATLPQQVVGDEDLMAAAMGHLPYVFAAIARAGVEEERRKALN